MFETKNWTQNEDNILKSIISEKKIRKWSRISKILEQEYKIYGRSAKQCRQRWNICQHSFINIQQWSYEEQNILYEYHNLYGNKWAKISLYLPGRSDNSIKNHFYSTLRKAFRGINRYITSTKKRTQMKPFKNIVMGKIIGLAQQGLEKKKKNCVQNNGIDIYSRCIQLKNDLIKYAYKLEKQVQKHEQTQFLVKQILKITKTYKCKKIKRKRKCESGDLTQQNVKPLIKNEKQSLQTNKQIDKFTSQIQFSKIDELYQPKKQQKALLEQHQPISLHTSNYLQKINQMYVVPNQFLYCMQATPVYQMNSNMNSYFTNMYSNYINYIIPTHFQITKRN